jgi:hypothetical protein
MYVNDTGKFPPTCQSENEIASGPLNCSATNDPFLNSLGVAGWRRPYDTLWSQTHPWGGAVTYINNNDPNNPFYTACLNDDKPNGGYTDNSGTIPDNVLIAIDKIIDDRNLSTGMARQSTNDGGSPIGEICLNIGQ